MSYKEMKEVSINRAGPFFAEVVEHLHLSQHKGSDATICTSSATSAQAQTADDAQTYAYTQLAKHADVEATTY